MMRIPSSAEFYRPFFCMNRRDPSPPPSLLLSPSLPSTRPSPGVYRSSCSGTEGESKGKADAGSSPRSGPTHRPSFSSRSESPDDLRSKSSFVCFLLPSFIFSPLQPRLILSDQRQRKCDCLLLIVSLRSLEETRRVERNDAPPLFFPEKTLNLQASSLEGEGFSQVELSLRVPENQSSTKEQA